MSGTLSLLPASRLLLVILYSPEEMDRMRCFVG